MNHFTLFRGTTMAMAIFGASVLATQAQTNVTTLPGVVVSNTMPALKEEMPVGPYQQPEWTTERRFPSTRVYLQQMPGNAGFEQWVRYQDFHDGTVETRFQEEVEIGLPHRFQLDLYETWAIDQDRLANQQEYSAEVRYALADWGKIPLNPTLYLEYAEHNESPNTLEGKLLFGTDITPDWHWGLNLACEQELSGKTPGTDNTELAASQGISYTLIDQKLSAGMEMEFYHEHARNTAEQWEYLIGPSVQWRPTSWSHIDFSPLFGCTHDAPKIEAYVVIGIDFGTGTSKEHYAPTSLRGQ